MQVLIIIEVIECQHFFPLFQAVIISFYTFMVTACFHGEIFLQSLKLI